MTWSLAGCVAFIALSSLIAAYPIAVLVTLGCFHLVLTVFLRLTYTPSPPAHHGEAHASPVDSKARLSAPCHVSALSPCWRAFLRSFAGLPSPPSLSSPLLHPFSPSLPRCHAGQGVGEPVSRRSGCCGGRCACVGRAEGERAGALRCPVAAT